ncbi:hypothetical protein BGZ97_007095, partial [Linnemannia gamsii]
ARALPQKRSPDTNDDDSNNGSHSDLIVYPPGKHDGHTPYLPGKGGGSLSTDKRRKKRSDTKVVQAEATATGAGKTLEKRNLFSRLFNTNHDRGHHPRHRQPQPSNKLSNENDRNTGSVEEYSYWNAEEEDEEGIDDEDDLEQHSGIYEDDYDDDDDDKGRYEDLGLVSQGVARASTPIVIEPFIRHPAHGSSLFDTESNSQDQAEDSNNHGESNNKIDNEDEDLDRIRASHPWYQQQQLHPSSSSSSKYHAVDDNDSHENDNNNEDDNNILTNQIWIVDDWDEDFDGVEETIDDLIDWIDDLDHHMHMQRQLNS